VTQRAVCIRQQCQKLLLLVATGGKGVAIPSTILTYWQQNDTLCCSHQLGVSHVVTSFPTVRSETLLIQYSQCVLRRCRLLFTTSLTSHNLSHISRLVPTVAHCLCIVSLHTVACCLCRVSIHTIACCLCRV
jgi:hypothetical protein